MVEKIKQVLAETITKGRAMLDSFGGFLSLQNVYVKWTVIAIIAILLFDVVSGGSLGVTKYVVTLALDFVKVSFNWLLESGAILPLGIAAYIYFKTKES